MFSVIVLLSFSITISLLFDTIPRDVDYILNLVSSIANIAMSMMIALLLLNGHFRTRKELRQGQESRIERIWRYLISKWQNWIAILIGSLMVIAFTFLSLLTSFRPDDFITINIFNLSTAILWWGTAFGIWHSYNSCPKVVLP